MIASDDKRPWRFTSKDRMEMRNMRIAGFTYKEISRRFKCSRQLVQQVAPFRSTSFREKKIERKYGCSKAQYDELLAIGKKIIAQGHPGSRRPIEAWLSQKRSAASRGIEWLIGAWDWWMVWQASGKWEFRGRGRGYMMCRFGDSGPYSLDNIYIASGSHNAALRHRIKPSSRPSKLEKTA